MAGTMQSSDHPRQKDTALTLRNLELKFRTIRQYIISVYDNCYTGQRHVYSESLMNLINVEDDRYYIYTYGRPFQWQTWISDHSTAKPEQSPFTHSIPGSNHKLSNNDRRKLLSILYVFPPVPPPTQFVSSTVLQKTSYIRQDAQRRTFNHSLILAKFAMEYL